GKKRLGILVRHHARDDDQGPRHALLEIAERGGGDAAALGIVPAVEPDLAALRAESEQLARGEALHPCRPFSTDDAGLERRLVDLEGLDRTQRRNREPGIVE